MEQIVQHWKPIVVSDDPFYKFLIVDNWYTPNEEKAIWSELDFYSNLPKQEIIRAENSIVARDDKGNSLGKSYRFYIQDYYTDVGRSKSHIFNCMYKQNTPEFGNLVDNIVPYNRSYWSCNKQSTMVSYYEENDHYKEHSDTFMWSQLIWFVKDESLLNGGDLVFTDSNIKVKLKHNRCVFFPSCYMHKVLPLNFKNKINEMGYGRYTITHFWFFNTENKPFVGK